MYSSSEQIEASEQAGKALMSVAWESRKAAKKELSAKCRDRSHWKKPNSTVKLDHQIKNTGSTIAEAVDAAVDRFVERVEEIMRQRGKDGIGQLLDRLDQVMPEDPPPAKLLAAIKNRK